MASCWWRRAPTRQRSPSSTAATSVVCSRASGAGSTGAEVASDLTAETFAAALEATPRSGPRPADSRAAHSGEAFADAGVDGAYGGRTATW
jgi:hypothetical protein